MMTQAKALGAMGIAALLLATAGCGSKKAPVSQANATQTAEGTPATAAGEDDGNVEVAAPPEEAAEDNDTTPVKNLVAAHNVGVVRSGAVVRTSAPVRIAPRGALARYVDMHPREVEDGRSFLGEPAVKHAIAASVRDAAIRNFIYHYTGPDAPIAASHGRILAWGCEAHNCGFHNWSVSILPDGSSAEVCYYHNDDSPDGPATWYLPGGRTAKRAGNCPDQ